MSKQFMMIQTSAPVAHAAIQFSREHDDRTLSVAFDTFSLRNSTILDRPNVAVFDGDRMVGEALDTTDPLDVLRSLANFYGFDLAKKRK